MPDGVASERRRCSPPRDDSVSIANARWSAPHLFGLVVCGVGDILTVYVLLMKIDAAYIGCCHRWPDSVSPLYGTDVLTNRWCPVEPTTPSLNRPRCFGRTSRHKPKTPSNAMRPSNQMFPYPPDAENAPVPPGALKLESVCCRMNDNAPY